MERTAVVMMTVMGVVEMVEGQDDDGIDSDGVV